MWRRLVGGWRSLRTFDRLGAALVAWEGLSLAVGLVLLPLARRGLISPSSLTLLAVNAIGLGTALVAWLLTHILVPRSDATSAGESVQEFVESRVRTFREGRRRTPNRG